MIDAESRLLACRIVSGIQPFSSQSCLLKMGIGCVSKAGEQILKALTTASECRGESQPPQRAPSQTKTTAGF
jgi:hypothetical protein